MRRMELDETTLSKRGKQSRNGLYEPKNCSIFQQVAQIWVNWVKYT